MKSLITFLSVILSFNFSQAGSCEPVDLRDQLGPILNQDGAGFCYAYTAADILSFKLGKRVSPVDIAMQYVKRRDELMYRKGLNAKYLNEINSDRKDDIASGGFVRYALSYSQDAGFCEDNKINSNDFRTDRDLFRGLVNLNQLSLQEYSLSDAGSASCSKFSQIQKIFPGVTIADIQNTANQSNLMNVGAKIANEACEPRFKATTPLRFRSLSNPGAANEILTGSQFNEIDSVLSKKQPISLSLKMDKLYNFGRSSISSQPRHAITLAGRKMNPSTGKCEYILKNSWGPECDRHYKVRCEGGYVYVPEDIFRSVVYAADYVE
ncbi:hypothetical protein [Pseudobdellovibrio sp. HCB154]|uniref:hypothetical protein n=1 Tax=Pseudobdellovibrio sp. HCB154 TaxID=3386277 RepID=UPI0039173436